MSPDFIVGVLIVVVVAVFISIFLRASIRQQSSIDRNELQQNISELFIEMLAYYSHPFLTETELGSNESIGPDYALSLIHI